MPRRRARRCHLALQGHSLPALGRWVGVAPDQPTPAVADERGPAATGWLTVARTSDEANTLIEQLVNTDHGNDKRPT